MNRMAYCMVAGVVLALMGCSGPPAAPQQAEGASEGPSDAAVDAIDSAAGDAMAGDEPCLAIDGADVPIENRVPPTLVIGDDDQASIDKLRADVELTRQQYAADPTNCDLAVMLQDKLANYRQLENSLINLAAEQAGLQSEVDDIHRRQAEICAKMKPLMEGRQSTDRAEDLEIAASCREYGVEIRLP